MLTYDVAGEGPTSEAQYYERGAVLTFLARAEATRACLQGALIAAHARRRAAEAQLDASADRAAGRALEAGAVGAALRDERDAVWDAIATTLAEAEREAAEVIAAAEVEAGRLRRTGHEPAPVLVSPQRWGRTTSPSDGSGPVDLLAG